MGTVSCSNDSILNDTLGNSSKIVSESKPCKKIDKSCRDIEIMFPSEFWTRIVELKDIRVVIKNTIKSILIWPEMCGDSYDILRPVINKLRVSFLAAQFDYQRVYCQKYEQQSWRARPLVIIKVLSKFLIYLFW